MPPQLIRRARRLATPQELREAPELEQIHTPLFSAIALDGTTIPSEVTAFNYNVGGTVSGAGGGAVTPATIFHTNLEQGNTLSAPKVFTCYAVRTFLSPLDYTANAPTLADPSNATARSNDDALDDALILYYSTVLTVSVGPKDYVRSPLFLVPGNESFAGIAHAHGQAGAAATQQYRLSSPGSVGKLWTLNTYPFVISPQQTFNAVLRNTGWTTVPGLVDDKLLFVILDGVLSREVL